MLPSATMTNQPNSSSVYALGSADYEQERLIRQAKWLAPHTERLFREASIGPGQRVIDLGSGVGDVSMLAARLVSPAGEVVGVERNPQAIARASARVADGGLKNVRFTQADVAQLPSGELFDAAVGRYILMFLPDPVGVLRSLAALVKPGGVLAFQEATWKNFNAQCEPLPLWRASAKLLEQVMTRSGVNPETGPALPRLFVEAGLPAPVVRTDRLLGAEVWLPEVLQTLQPRINELQLDTSQTGNFSTLADRLAAEVSNANSQTPLPDLVSAWTRK